MLFNLPGSAHGHGTVRNSNLECLWQVASVRFHDEKTKQRAIERQKECWTDRPFPQFRIQAQLRKYCKLQLHYSRILDAKNGAFFASDTNLETEGSTCRTHNFTGNATNRYAPIQFLAALKHHQRMAFQGRTSCERYLKVEPDTNTAVIFRNSRWAREAAVAAAAVFVAVGLSLSLSSSALGYSPSGHNIISLTDKDDVVSDNPQHRLLASLPPDFEVTDCTKDGLYSQSFDETTHVKEGTTETRDENMPYSGADSIASRFSVGIGPFAGEEAITYKRAQKVMKLSNSEINITTGIGDKGDAEETGNAAPSLTVASSDLVAVAALGSAVSAASAAGRAISQSGTTFPHAGSGHTLATALHHLGGGGFAGAVGATIVYPLDTIKTRMQAQSFEEGEELRYKDALDCFRKLLFQEGPGSLYTGLVPQLLGIVPEKALKLTVNEVLMEMLEQWMPGAGLWTLEFIAGGGGGFSQVVVTNPMEMVKVRLQTQSKNLSSKGIFQVVKELGLQGLYYGSSITLARDVPSSALFFACYALLRQLYPEQSFWAGFLAAIPATILVTPLDVIKTRLQMETPLGEEPYKDAWHCYQSLLHKEGPRALFKGGLLRVLRASPQFGITLMVYTIVCNGP